MNGSEMAVRLSQAHPETQVVLMSGYAPEALTMKPNWYFIQKPFMMSEIRERIMNILTKNCLVA
jgi:hypothetical protein